MKSCFSTMFLGILTLLCFDSAHAYSKFVSKEDLIQNLKNVGFDHVVEMNAKNLSFKIYNSEQNQTVQIPGTISSDEMERVPDLDIDDASILKTANSYNAFKIANSFVCYAENKVSRSFNRTQLSYCLFIPVAIEEVVKALNEKRIK